MKFLQLFALKGPHEEKESSTKEEKIRTTCSSRATDKKQKRTDNFYQCA